MVELRPELYHLQGNVTAPKSISLKTYLLKSGGGSGGVHVGKLKRGTSKRKESRRAGDSRVKETAEQNRQRQESELVLFTHSQWRQA